MSRKSILCLVVFVVILAIASDILWNVLVRQPKVVTATPNATATVTSTITPTMVPTVTMTPFPTSVPTIEPTPIPAPLGDWKLLYEFSGGPTVLVNSPCYAGELTDCIGKEVEIYLEGYQANEVYLNGFNNERVDLWTIRLVPGHNQLVVPSADDIGIGNMTNIDMAEFDSTGYYLSCVPNPSGEGCDCTQYNDRTTIYQSPVEGGFFLTTIEFWSEYSNVFFLNDMVKEQSIAIESGTILILPKYDHQTWDITVLPFYGERPTPMPSRTPQP